MQNSLFDKTKNIPKNTSLSDMGVTRPYNQSPYASPSQAPKTQSSNKNPRYGMSNVVWDKTLSVTEVLLDIIKAFMVVGGILSASLADVIFGAAGITILFGGGSAIFNGTPVWIIGTILSLGTSAIQIFLWSAIQKRGITLNQILHWKRLPNDMKGFLSMAGIVWFLDTLIDMSPIALLVQNSQYQTITPLYWAMIVAVSIIVFILCGFSEIMTSNMRSILNGQVSSSGNSNSSYKRYSSDSDFPVSLPRKK